MVRIADPTESMKMVCTADPMDRDWFCRVRCADHSYSLVESTNSPNRVPELFSDLLGDFIVISDVWTIRFACAPPILRIHALRHVAMEA